MARVLTEEQKAIMRAIEANNASIRQLRLANKHLVGMLPDFSADERGKIRDPRTGKEISYTDKPNKRTRGKKS